MGTLRHPGSYAAGADTAEDETSLLMGALRNSHREPRHPGDGNVRSGRGSDRLEDGERLAKHPEMRR
jgi:hypothetical protein